MTTVQSSDFVAQLLTRDVRSWHDHPFHVRMHEGRLTRAHLRAWVANRYYYQGIIPRKDAAIIANCPIGAVRRRWAGRLRAQDGEADDSGEIAEWRRLATAIGVPEESLLDETLVVPGVRFAADAYLAFARDHSWIEGVAASLTQAHAAAAMSVRVAAFEKWYPWIDRAAIACFGERKERLARESADAQDLLREYCISAELQQRAREALHFKTAVLWGMLDALEHAYSAEERTP